MILIAGGSGTLGMQVVHLLARHGLEMRLLTRTPERVRRSPGDAINIVQGDVRDTGAVERAVTGARTVISAVHGFAGARDTNPYNVDWLGNANLIKAALANGVEHFILVSIHGAAPDHPMDLFRMKYQAEQKLLAASLPWTILRPTAYMETWLRLIGEPLTSSGKTQVFGRGENPINFVSAHDVARFIELAVMESKMRNVAVDIGGPQNLTMNQVVHTFMAVTGKTGKVSHVPLPLMRLMAVLMRPVNPAIARQIQAGAVMDTSDMSFDSAPVRSRYPSIPVTNLADAIRRDYVDARLAA